VVKQFFSQNFGNGTDTGVPLSVFFVFVMYSLGFGERRFSYRLWYTC